MDKIKVIYWSQSGNTEEMAKAVAKGIEEAGKEAEVLEVSSAAVSDLKDASSFALGCPAMGDEVLEEDEMEPFVQELESFVSGKNVALFGSYGWGDGQWMQDWTGRMEKAGAKIVGGEGLICQETPEDAQLDECKALGKNLAEA